MPRAAAALLAAILLAPAAAAQEAGVDASDFRDRETSFVTFYGHIFGFGRDADNGLFGPMPMNTEFPFGEADLSAGTSDTNAACGVDPSGAAVGTASCEDNLVNEVWLYTTAGFVDVSDRFEFDYGKVHNERGLTKDFVLDTTKDVTATFYMSGDLHGWLFLFSDPNGSGVPIDPEDVPWPGPGWNWDPGVLPQWQVKATLYAAVLGEYGGEANTPPPVAQAVEQGTLEVLAEGVSNPVDVVSLEATGNPTVWQFDVNMGPPKTAVVPKEKSLLVRFQWWSTALGGQHVVPEAMSWNVNSGEFYPTRVTVPVKNAFDVELVVPQFIHDKLVILGLLNTPWGSYDVDHDSVALTIEREGGGEITPVRIEKLADFSVAHGGHYKPVNVTWVWDYKRDDLQPGTYTARVSAANHQGSATGECAAQFTILEGGDPGDIVLGECGQRTATDQQIRDAAQAGGETQVTDTALPIPSVGLLSAAVAPLPSALAFVPALALALALALGLVRRWGA